MNVMTIILSITASLLVAVLILFWQNDNKAAKGEPAVLQQQLDELRISNAELRRKLDAGQKAQEDQAKGLVNNSSPYQGIKGQAEYAADQKKFEKNEIAIAQTADRLNSSAGISEDPSLQDPLPIEPQVDLASQEFTSSALDSAVNGTAEVVEAPFDPIAEEKKIIDSGVSEDLLASPSEQITSNQQMKRRAEIRDSKVYARISYIESTEEGTTILAKLAPDTYLDEGSILAVRRNETGIAGKVKVVSINTYPGHGNVAIIEPAVTGFSSIDFVPVQHDELILPPRWQMSQ